MKFTRKEKRKIGLGIVIFIAIFSMFVVCSGCEAIDSIKVGGGYTDTDGTKIEGDVEIVLSEVESKDIGLPVFNSDTTKYVLLSEGQLKKIVAKIEADKKTIVPSSPLRAIAEHCK